MTLWRRLFGTDHGIVVRTVTCGRKMPVEKGGNAEFILTANVKRCQTPEEVMSGLAKMIRCQLLEIKNQDGGTPEEDYRRW